MKHEVFDNVWFAIESDRANAINMTMRSELMIAVTKSVKDWNVSEAETARRLKITRPRLNDLMREKISKFSLGALMKLATRAGINLRLSVGDIHIATDSPSPIRRMGEATIR